MRLSSVVVADDHPVYLKALEEVIADDPELILAGSAADGAEAVTLITATRPDIAVLDVEMPRLSGHRSPRGSRSWRSRRGPVPVGQHGRRDGLRRARRRRLRLRRQGRADARDPPGDPEVASGYRALGGGVADPLVEGLQIRADRANLTLTDREEQVLALAATGQTVAAMGKAMHLSPATIKVHLSTLYAKLGVSDRASAVAEAIRRGLVD